MRSASLYPVIASHVDLARGDAWLAVLFRWVCASHAGAITFLQRRRQPDTVSNRMRPFAKVFRLMDCFLASALPIYQTRLMSKHKPRPNPQIIVRLTPAYVNLSCNTGCVAPGVAPEQGRADLLPNLSKSIILLYYSYCRTIGISFTLMRTRVTLAAIFWRSPHLDGVSHGKHTDHRGA